MTRIRLVVRFIALLALLSGPAAAQPAAPDETSLFQDVPAPPAGAARPPVRTASTYEQRRSEAPSTIHVVTAAEIKYHGYQTLADVLRSLPGLYVSYDRNYTYLGVRGFSRPGDYNTRVLLLVNGHRLNDNIWDAASLGTEAFLDLAVVDRIEIVVGPTSSLYGSNAVFAVVNVFTKRGRDLRGFEVAGAWASNDTYRAGASYGDRFKNGLEVFASGAAYDSRGQDLYFPEFDAPETNRGRVVGADCDRYARLWASLGYRDLTLQGGFSWRRKGVPTASFGTVFGDTRTHTIDQRAFAELRYERELRSWLELSARTYFDEAHYEGTYPFAASSPEESPDGSGTFLNRDSYEGKFWGVEVRAALRPWRWLRLVGGAEVQHHFQQDQDNVDEHTVPQVKLADRRGSVVQALFLQAAVAPRRWVSLNCGLRFDYYSTFGSTVNPRCGLVLSPLPRTSFKVLYGDAFRAPSAGELYYSDGGDSSKPSVGLQPEKIRSVELALEHRFLGLRATSAFYYNRITNLIDLVPDPADNLLQYRNGESAEAIGAELALEGRWGQGWEARASYSFQAASEVPLGRWLSNSPHHLAKGHLIAPIVRDRLLAGLELLYTSARRTLKGTETAQYLLANVALSAPNLLWGFWGRAAIYNLFNKNYGVPGSAEHVQDVIIQDGRTFWLEVGYTY